MWLLCVAPSNFIVIANLILGIILFEGPFKDLFLILPKGISLLQSSKSITLQRVPVVFDYFSKIVSQHLRFKTAEYLKFNCYGYLFL